MPRQLKISSAAHGELQRRAKAEQRTMSAVLNRLLGLTDVGVPAAGSPRAVGAGQTRGVVTVHAHTDTTICRRCGHEARKHTPRCYVMGCACRSLTA